MSGTVLMTGSARKAAAQVYRHHSAVTPRIAHDESPLGFSCTTPLGAQVPRTGPHLRDTAD